MAPPNALDAQYKELLNPIKDAEKSFNIDVSEILLNFIREFSKGHHSANFNRAALIVQSSANVYCKKVEYLHNLATQLHHTLQKQQKGELQQPKKDAKEKEKKVKKLIDPFVSIEIKPGNNLSCLKKKNSSKATSKTPLKKVTSPVPVHLLSNDTDEKGEVFYDTRGEPIGNKGDFAMNRCRITSSGWLLLPTINPKLIPSLEAVPEYDEDLNINIGENDGAGDFDDIMASPDEGIGASAPPSSNVPQSTPGLDSNTENNTETPIISSGVPSSVDEGIGNTPTDDMVDSPGAENIPADDDEAENQNLAPQPIRQSTRQALRTCQLAPEDDPLAGIAISKELLKRKKIEKKKCRILPEKLKNPDDGRISPISAFCNKTFFSADDKGLSKSMIAFDTPCFLQRSEFVHRLLARLEVVKNCKNLKNMVPLDDSGEALEAIEISREANEDDETLNIPFDENEIHIDHDPVRNFPDLPFPAPVSDGDNASLPGPDLPSPDISHVAFEENENYLKEIQKFVNNSDITQRVHEWERSVKPFLDELEHRESFDINLYGSRILNSFENNNRKQTMTFRDFCKDREKWEIHRYFMALLPLANVGNVSIESEFKDDGTEEIFVTLLSRKMHHTELEEFGHNDGSHS